MKPQEYTLPLGSFNLPEHPSPDEIIGALLTHSNHSLDWANKIDERWKAINPKHKAPKHRLIQVLVHELNRFAPPFAYVGHAPHDENNWGVWIDLGKLHEAEETGKLIQDTIRPTKGRSTYVLIHDETGLRLFKRRGWVEVWKV